MKVLEKENILGKNYLNHILILNEGEDFLVYQLSNSHQEILSQYGLIVKDQYDNYFSVFTYKNCFEEKLQNPFNLNKYSIANNVFLLEYSIMVTKKYLFNELSHIPFFNSVYELMKEHIFENAKIRLKNIFLNNI